MKKTCSFDPFQPLVVIMRQNIYFLSLLLSGLLMLGDTGQATAQSGFMGGGHFMLGNPRGEFGRNVENIGFGGSLFGGFRLGPTPVVLGIEGGAMIYGHERRSEPLSLTIPDVRVDVTTSNNFFMGHALLRLQPQRGFVRPYVDGFLGFNHLNTTTSVDSEDYYEDDPVFRSTNFSDTSLSYGAGGGLMIKLVDSVTDGGDPFDVMLDLRLRYMIGGQAEYLREGSIERDLGSVTFDTFQSKTDALFFQVGVAVGF